MRLIMFSANQADQLLGEAIVQGSVNSVKLLLNAMVKASTPRCVEALKVARISGHTEVSELVADAQAEEASKEAHRHLQGSFSPHP